MAYVFTLVCVAIAAYTARTLVNARRSANWPAVTGTIVRSALSREPKAGHESGFSDSIDLAYSYTVDGRQFEGSRVAYGGIDKAKKAHSLHLEHPVGSTVTVFYDPASPHLCTLRRGLPKNMFALVAIGGMFAVLSLYMLVMIAIRWLS